jgi:S-formylglutathione hydrolase FrmB
MNTNISRRICMLTFTLSLVLMFGVVDLQASRIVSHDIESTAIANNKLGISSTRHIEVYLPDGYEDGKHRYPVIYWVPGWTGDAVNWGSAIYNNVLDDAISSGKITPTIAVFVDVHEGILCLNSPLVGNWEDFMVSELVPFIDKTYPTIPDPKARGLGGHSGGGYTAAILPILHPNVWGSIGMNDPAIAICWFTTDESDFPAELKSWFWAFRGVFSRLPSDINGYNSVDFYVKIMLQAGTSFNLNPDSPILCDLPINKAGEWVPEVRDKWSAFDLMNPNTIANYSAIWKKLLSITIVVPTLMEGTNSVSNLHFMSLLQSNGITTTRLDMPGGHADYSPERFIAITEQLLKAMQGSGTSVSSRGKLVATWGDIKSKP